MNQSQHQPTSSPNGDSPTKATKLSKQVHWGTIVMHEFPIILGDNPSVSSGPPLTMDWKHESRMEIRIDYFEFARNSLYQRRRKTRKELRWHSKERNQILLERGFSASELIEVALQCADIKESREANIEGGGRFESFRKILVKATKTGRTKSPSSFMLNATRGLRRMPSKSRSMRFIATSA